MKIQITDYMHILDENALDRLINLRKRIVFDRETSKDSKQVKELKRLEKVLTWLISYQLGQSPSYVKKKNSESLFFTGFPPEFRDDIYDLHHYAERII
jgi:hypothetical protein